MAARWTAVLRAAQEEPARRLVLVPHAGSGPNALMPAVAGLPGDYEIVGVTMPGRERRLAEEVVDLSADPHAVVAGILDELAALPRRHTVLLGHSMGAGVAVALTLAKPDGFAAAVLSAYPSGGAAPERAGSWTDADLLEILRLGGGTPDAVLTTEFWRRQVLDVLRADLALSARLGELPGRVPVPLTVLGGASDELVPAVELGGWARRAGAGLRSRILPGGHFYLLDPANRAALTAAVLEAGFR
jgi:surfactin synthase thioesterase subunit